VKEQVWIPERIFFSSVCLGPCPSVTFESSTRHCLASFRPTRRSPEGKHVVSEETPTLNSKHVHLYLPRRNFSLVQIDIYRCTFSQLFQMQNLPTDRPLICNPVQQFPGGPTYRLLSRSKLLLRPGASDHLLAAHSHESSKTVSGCVKENLKAHCRTLWACLLSAVYCPSLM